MNDSLKQIEIMKGMSNLIALGDFNTMGNGSTISSRREIGYLSRAAKRHSMYLLNKEHNETWHDWSYLTDSGRREPITANELHLARKCDLDHIVASDELRFKKKGMNNEEHFYVLVRGWNQLNNDHKADYLANVSDHSAIYTELL